MDIAPAAGVFQSLSVQGGAFKSQSTFGTLPGIDRYRLSRLDADDAFSNKPMDYERRLELTCIELQLQSLDTSAPTTDTRQNDQGDLSHDDLALFKLYVSHVLYTSREPSIRGYPLEILPSSKSSHHSSMNWVLSREIHL